jgi:hypothetical protein
MYFIDDRFGILNFANWNLFGIWRFGIWKFSILSL